MEVNPWLTYFCAVTRCEHMGFLVSVENTKWLLEKRQQVRFVVL